MVEVKRSIAPTLTRGFWSAWNELGPQRGFIVYAGQERYPMADRVEAVSVAELAAELASAAS